MTMARYEVTSLPSPSRGCHKQTESVCLSHVIHVASNDEVSVYTSSAGAVGEVKTAPSTCTLRLEYMGPI